MIGLAAEALRLFRRGSDTCQIAKRLGIREAEACELIHTARQSEKFGGARKGSDDGLK